MSFKNIFLKQIRDENGAKKILKLSVIYFFTLTMLYCIFALTEFGAWSFKSSNTYLRIFEVLFTGLSISLSWRVVVRILLYLQILTVIYIFIGDHGMKIINIMSLIVLFYADLSLSNYFKMGRHIT